VGLLSRTQRYLTQADLANMLKYDWKIFQPRQYQSSPKNLRKLKLRNISVTV
jgi:hypothetical protein